MLPEAVDLSPFASHAVLLSVTDSCVRQRSASPARQGETAQLLVMWLLTCEPVLWPVEGYQSAFLATASAHCQAIRTFLDTALHCQEVLTSKPQLTILDCPT